MYICDFHISQYDIIHEYLKTSEKVEQVHSLSNNEISTGNDTYSS